MNRAAAGPLDAGAERIKKVRQIDNLRLPGRILEYGLAIREDGGHQQVLGPGYRYGVEDDMRALQPVRPRLNETVLHDDVGTQRLQAGNVEIDRSGADRTAAGKRYVCLAEPGDQRTKHQDRCAHRLYEFVRRRPLGKLARVDLDIEPVVDGDLRSHGLQQGNRCRNVFQVRDIADPHGLTGEQRARKNWQRRVLGARYLHLARKPRATLDEEFVQGSLSPARLLPFVRGQGPNRERVDLVADERTETTINELVPGQGPFALELLGDDQRLEMVVVVARDTDRGIFEALGDQFLDLGRFHRTLYGLLFRGRAV